MAEAVASMFPGAKFGIGPTIEDGFYYDFDLPRGLTPEDLAAIEEKMRQLVAADEPFVRQEVDRDTAQKLFAQQPYKLELIQDLRDESLSIYAQGTFTDLCRGPHVASSGQVGPFKLLHVAGAYWRGDERRPMLQRIYGTAFHTEAELQAHLRKLEEVARRDHRRLGRELDLYSISDEVGAGLIIWHPKGAVVRHQIESFWKEEHTRRGYQLIYTPHIGNVNLWKRSGHWDFYRENMYSPMEVEGSLYMLKPMNCPFHIQIYQSHLRSYRELPIRLAELGTVYRYERSGTLHGLLRVRGFTQDDAHLFCRPDQVTSEVAGVLEFARYMLSSFGFNQFELDLSVRDPDNPQKYLGSPEVWDQTEAALADALKAAGYSYHLAEGEAVFYGPKIDLKLIDALGRAWQGPTIQVDFNFPQQFDLNYVGEDGHEHRVVMIHRTVLGSMERFLGNLIEHYAGAFPIWLAPVQAVLIPIADRHLDYARQVRQRLQAGGLRVEVNDRSERMNLKIREAEQQKVPYMLVVGDREMAGEAVSVRLRNGQDIGAQPVDVLLAMAQDAIRERA
jgi:threonyl-tRNA synthetase